MVCETSLWRDFVRDEEEGHQEWRSTTPTFGNLILMWPFSRLALKKKAACLYCSRRPTKVCCFHVGKGSKSLKSLTKRIWNTRCQVGGTRPFQLLKFHSNNIVMQLNQLFGIIVILIRLLILITFFDKSQLSQKILLYIYIDIYNCNLQWIFG